MSTIHIKDFKILFNLILLFFIWNIAYPQAEIPKKPALQTSVYDSAKMLSGLEKNELEQKLINYSDTTSTQIVIATVNTIHGEDIAFYAAQWAEKWGIGQEKEDNGIFILVAKDDHKLTIQTGQGVEHLLTDALSKRIITNIVTPEFRKGNFYAGLDKGTTAIMQVMNGEYKGTPQRSNKDTGIPVGIIIFFVIILFIILSNRNRGNRGGRRHTLSRSLLDAIILSNMGRGGFGGGGFGGGSSGGGGFGGGFGGGSFGGGGASGSW